MEEDIPQMFRDSSAHKCVTQINTSIIAIDNMPTASPAVTLRITAKWSHSLLLKLVQTVARFSIHKLQTCLWGIEIKALLLL